MKYTENDGLLVLAEGLDKSYYSTILGFCENAKLQASSLQQLEIHKTTSQYVNLCNKLIAEIQLYIGNKTEHLLPYLKTLAVKSSAGHDCRACNGGCDLGHELVMAEMKDSHLRIKESVYRLQMVALPLYSETKYPVEYKSLRNLMAKLENSLADLLTIEETKLIPQIIKAQKNIYVHD